MRMNNLHHFTEHHRYVAYREFSLSQLDQRMLSQVYQPIIGAFAIGLYHFLYQHIAADKVGFSAMDSQRKLFLLLGIEPSEKGRAYFIEQTTKLEAVGLLQTSRLMFQDSEDYMFEYALQSPLSPDEFFSTQHLTLLLRDKVGKYTVLSLREQFITDEPFAQLQADAHRENISVPFYEMFRLNTHVIDYELEQALHEVTPSRRGAAAQDSAQEEPVLNYADIITRFPKYSYNRPYVEKLRLDREGMGILDYIARKFELTPVEICRLLDEDGVFNTEGRLVLDELQHRAHLQFRQTKRRGEWREREQQKIEQVQKDQKAQRSASHEMHSPDRAAAQIQEEVAVEMEFYVEVAPQCKDKCDVHQYNMMLRNAPYTKLLEKYFPGAVPDSFLDMFTKIDLNYKLPDEVINVLIHYIMMLTAQEGTQRISGAFVERIASNMLVKQVQTYEQAVQYIRTQASVTTDSANRTGQAGSKPRAAGGRGSNSRYAKQQRPAIPIVQPSTESVAWSQSDRERALELARRLDEGK
ncbi:DnaD domain protein [Paenibacillus arenosi]|uniref:DnaD domain protein n=1 Tax=Paenibacillus arenosi TaxID=2774142 RepID=A0ABR9AYB4_9BACL|nr:DnaD domain protein [Paenibacillus arenosi]MBD8499095.1 DnaD domain protein [Paenibacillus arenosi]